MSLNPSFDEIKRRVNLGELCDALGMERRGAATWVCPCCGSGNGPNRSAAFSVKGDGWRCFSCGEHGDCFDLVGAVRGIEDKLEQRAEVCALAGIPTFDDDRGPEIESKALSNHSTGARAAEPRKAASARMSAESDEITRFKQEQHEYIGECQRALEGSDGERYMASRGVGLETCRDWGAGWDAASRRVVMPYEPGGWAWVARTVDGASPKYVKPKLPDGLKMPAYANESAIGDARELWVVEGWLDMLALELCGRHALALVGTGNGEAATALEGFDGLVLAALDSDGPGQEASARLAGQLRDAGVACAVAGLWPEGAKDPGELLEGGNLAVLAAHLGRVEDAAREGAAAELAEARESRLRELGVSDAAEGLRSVRERRDLPEHTPTGLPAVDGALGGGLPAGLTILGATSSTGKTTLCVQVAEHAAIGGRPVLYVTVEQSLLELAAKQLARALYELKGARVGTRELLSGRERAGWCDVQEDALNAAYEELERELGGRLRYMVPAGQPRVSEIREAASLMADAHGTAPLVIVDYLQLLAPANERQTEKQAVDCNVMSLRQLARDLRTPVLLISSLNRASYSGEVTMEAYKESGAIEYAADVLLGLQPAGIGHEDDARQALAKHKSMTIRQCELAVLKNRNGALPAEPVPLVFDAVACTFECSAGEEGVRVL